MKHEKQIVHIEKHQAEFDAHQGYHRSVRQYFMEYNHIPDLYVNLCRDLGITPIQHSPSL